MISLVIFISLAEYADLHGKVSERRIWQMLIDLVKVLKTLYPVMGWVINDFML